MAWSLLEIDKESRINGESSPLFFCSIIDGYVKIIEVGYVINRLL